MDIRNFLTHAAERRRAGAILGTPPPVDGNDPACITDQYRVGTGLKYILK